MGLFDFLADLGKEAFEFKARKEVYKIGFEHGYLGKIRSMYTEGEKIKEWYDQGYDDGIKQALNNELKKNNLNDFGD
ncbi:MAG: hypothetical protein MI685_07735 [Chlorobiales bacterium]|nr:hypothetical protein [Chlorobiales bacterium]